MDYTKETVPSLKQMCKERKIRRYSKKTKTELIDVLRHYDENGPEPLVLLAEAFRQGFKIEFVDGKCLLKGDGDKE